MLGEYMQLILLRHPRQRIRTVIKTASTNGYQTPVDNLALLHIAQAQFILKVSPFFFLQDLPHFIKICVQRLLYVLLVGVYQHVSQSLVIWVLRHLLIQVSKHFFRLLWMNSYSIVIIGRLVGQLLGNQHLIVILWCKQKLIHACLLRALQDCLPVDLVHFLAVVLALVHRMPNVDARIEKLVVRVVVSELCRTCRRAIGFFVVCLFFLLIFIFV